MRLRWTTPAANDLYHIVRHIQKDNAAAAAKVAETLYDGCANLRDFPRRDIVVYKIQDQVVEIVRLYHGAQDWP